MIDQNTQEYCNATPLPDMPAKGTYGSCEIALHECRSNSSKGLRALVVAIRDELMEATEPEIWARKQRQRMEFEERDEEDEDDSEIIEEDEEMVDEEEMPPEGTGTHHGSSTGEAIANVQIT
jgi:hypothetical protein